LDESKERLVIPQKLQQSQDTVQSPKEEEHSDFINIWEESDFRKQSDSQKSRSLT